MGRVKLGYDPPGEFSHAEFAAMNTARRKRFLARMEEVILWTKLLGIMEPLENALAEAEKGAFNTKTPTQLTSGSPTPS
jgi:hypothetical protein